MPPKFVPREHKRRRLVKQSSTKHHEQDESANRELIIPETQSERDARRAQLAAELRERQPESKASGKKRKRLDKYIETKLKKEENLELLKKLAAQKVDTSLLQSSKKLGRVTESKRERVSRALQERNAGVDVNGDNDHVLFQRRPEHSLSNRESSDSEDDVAESQQPTKQTRSATYTDALMQTSIQSANFGSGLKRPLQTNESGQPMIKKRKRRKPNKTTAALLANEELSDEERRAPDDPGAETEDSEEEEWHGFDSSYEKGSTAAQPEDQDSETNDDDSVHTDLEISSDEDDASGDDSTQPESEPEADDREAKATRVSAFKAWADSQRNAALDFTPSLAPALDQSLQGNFKPRAPSPDPLLEAVITTTADSTARPAAAITIARPEVIQKARLALPVVQEEQKIMEAIHSNPVVVICGATGSGKTTQVPQMMYESGYGSHIGSRITSESVGLQSKGLIGITQPRRVAAMSVAERVATELGPENRKRVAHQVRYDSNASRDSAIKFMTDGILLREISQDFILSKYSAIVIDEAHERSVNTDILIGMLSRIVGLRSELAKEEPEKHYPLKLVIMSATLRVADFAQNQRLFRNKSPPIIQAEGRQYPVTEHFSRRTRREYVSEMVAKVSRGHRKLPPGGMLVFLTSQNEIQTAVRQIREKLASGSVGMLAQSRSRRLDQMPVDIDDFEDGAPRQANDYLEGEDSDQDSDPEITGLDGDTDDKEFEVEDQDPTPVAKGILKPHILPLYAALPSSQQLRVFQSPPEGYRLIVLATNVAETSLTIPGIRYVFDCGRSKEKRYDNATGVQTFEIDWISKASASQRAGRAGRTGPGHCYRLYSSAVYEQFFAEHTTPEILRTPLESTVLQLKSMEIENVVNFPFPTPPDTTQLSQADRLLRNLGAIDDRTGKITDCGRDIMSFPVSPRFGKMLLLAQRNEMLSHAVALVAGLAVGELIIPEVQAGNHDMDDESSSENDVTTAGKTAAQKRHQAYSRAQATLSKWDDQSDVVKVLTAVAAHAEVSSKNQAHGTAGKFCAEYYLREKGMTEVQQLRRQLHNIVSARYPTQAGSFKDTLPLPSEKERKMLNQIVAAGFIDQIAVRSDLLQNETSGFGRKPRRAIEVAYRTLISSARPDLSLPLQDQEIQKSVFVHPSSVLAHLSVDEMPSYIVYSHLSRAPPATVGEGSKVPKTRLHPLTVIGAKQLAALADGTPLLHVGKPIGKIEELAGEGRTKRQCWVGIELRCPGVVSDSGWPLGAWKVVQKRDKGGEWEIEKVLAR